MGKSRLGARRGAASRNPVPLLSLDGEPAPPNKTRLTMYLDTAVVEYFRSRSGGRGYQTLINQALKQAIERENLEDVLRRVLREEVRPYKGAK